MELGLAEWTVLGVLGEGPTHGFAIAVLTAPGAALGRVWQLQRPVVYRALSRLDDAGLARQTAVESGPGPRRTVYAITAAGESELAGWLAGPVPHVRLLRSHLLMKLALLDRRGTDPADLLARQRQVLEKIEVAIAGDRARGEGFDVVLLTWRHSNAVAALRFLDEIS